MRFRLAYWLWWRWLAHVQFNGPRMHGWSSSMDPFYCEEDGWKRERLYRPDVGLTTHGANIATSMPVGLNGSRLCEDEGYQRDYYLANSCTVEWRMMLAT